MIGEKWKRSVVRTLLLYRRTQPGSPRALRLMIAVWIPFRLERCDSLTNFRQGKTT
jgi:hypothetical protein